MFHPHSFQRQTTNATKRLYHQWPWVECLATPRDFYHPPVITIFIGGIYKPFPVMGGKNGIGLATLEQMS